MKGYYLGYPVEFKKGVFDTDVVKEIWQGQDKYCNDCVLGYMFTRHEGIESNVSFYIGRNAHFERHGFTNKCEHPIEVHLPKDEYAELIKQASLVRSE